MTTGSAECHKCTFGPLKTSLAGSTKCSLLAAWLREKLQHFISIIIFIVDNCSGTTVKKNNRWHSGKDGVKCGQAFM